MLIIDSFLREDFGPIFEKTMCDYYQLVFNKEIQFKIVRPSLGHQIVMYPRLGVVINRTPSKFIIRKIYRDWWVRNRFFKRMLAQTYVTACMASFGLLATKNIRLSDYSVMDNTVLIEPGNRKIKVYYLEAGYIDSIIKDTFTSKYFNNELEYRLNHNYDFIPKILNHGKNWYREEFLSGRCLVRVKEEPLFNKAIDDILEYLRIIADETLEYVDVNQYVDDKYEHIIRRMMEAKEHKNINSYDNICEIALKAANCARKLNAQLPLVESHGDLQLGNLWLDTTKGKAYIIDWETHEKRSIWYDCVTMLLSTRRANKLRHMMFNRDVDTVRSAILKLDAKKDYDMLAVLGIITLEDIIFYLDDMLELPSNIGGDVFNEMSHEIDLMGWRESVMV